MKLLSQITESVWGNIRKKSLGEDVRAEKGTKVHTCLDMNIALMNPNCDYDGLMKSFFNTHFTYSVRFSIFSHMGLPKERIEKIKNDEDPYIHILKGYDDIHLIVQFWPYADITDKEFKDEYCELDYDTICKCMAEKLKEISDRLSFIGRGKYEIVTNKSPHNDVYGNNYGLEIVDSISLTFWKKYHPNENPDDFIKDLIKQFPELDTEDILYVTNVVGHEYIIPLYTYMDPINNIMNIQKYKDFTTEWFKK